MALSFVPAAGEGATEENYMHGDDGDRYTYHHLRRDLFDRLAATGLLMKPRYIVPSVHVTIARFITHDGFVLENSRLDKTKVVDQERVAALVERVEQINERLRQKYWPQVNGAIPIKGEWIVGQGKGLELCKGRSWYGGGENVVTGKGFP
ncbi:uncharacterized protein BDW43DRAFT_281492 [Aspergillus alliaceus]|uniref:uncharacterized protein n=1 Tax=Petromyces alliaceus TaxID=209559 RepID=UPI0012A567C8|nr:uncharacterized protein BDW43DRAFT_281492 [Aspergillus alliaceus]KAB8231736.1 hypothetical protein BDW43DRAFT_281492 [Aspergillus alliaceus]